MEITLEEAEMIQDIHKLEATDDEKRKVAKAVDAIQFALEHFGQETGVDQRTINTAILIIAKQHLRFHERKNL